MLRRTPLAYLVIIQFLSCACTVGLQGASIYSLQGDWSDTANPNGPWTYREGNNALPHVDWFAHALGEFDVPQPAWARSESGNNRLPTWFKAVTIPVIPAGTYDWQPGDIIVHTTDGGNGVGGGTANVTWTSPLDGTVNVDGAVWEGRDIGRSNHWALYLNSTLLTQGDVSSGDAYSRATPFAFAASGLSVNVGDVLSLYINATSTDGDFVGVRLNIDASSTVPEPASLTIFGVGILGTVAGGLIRRRTGAT